MAELSPVRGMLRTCQERLALGGAMSDVKPFRVVMKLRNTRMASIRGKRKQKEMDLLCKVHGGTWGAYEGLKKSPIILDRSGQERCCVCATRISRQAVVCS